jgi:hypothetical protein
MLKTYTALRAKVFLFFWFYNHDILIFKLQPRGFLDGSLPKDTALLRYSWRMYVFPVLVYGKA